MCSTFSSFIFCQTGELAFQSLKVSAARASASTSASFSSWSKSQGQQRAAWSSRSNSSFLAAGAAAAACASGAATIALCEKNLEDPMTVYGQNAAKNSPQAPAQAPAELAEENQSVTRKEVSPVATSPNVQDIPHDMTAEELRLEAATVKAKRHGGGLKIFSGNGNMSLAMEIAKVLGISLGKATVGKFADGEVNVQIHENVRGKDVYIIQPTCPPVNDNIMELLLMISTLNRASARRITVVIPYYGYARQDRKMQVRINYANMGAADSNKP